MDKKEKLFEKASDELGEENKEALRKKASDELENFKEEVENLPPKEIIDKAYELCIKEELLYFLDDIDYYAEEKIEVLLKEEYPLDFLYHEWLRFDAGFEESWINLIQSI